MGAAPTNRSYAGRLRATLAAASLSTLVAVGLVASAQAAPKLVDSNKAANRTSSVRVARPSGVVAGDVVVAAVTARARATTPISAPPGWRQVRRDSCVGPNRALLTQAIYVRVASLADPLTTVWSVGSATGVAAGLAAYRGVDIASPVQSSGGAVSRNSLLLRTPSVANGADTLVAGFFGRNEAGGITTPRGTTHRYLASTPLASVLAVDDVRNTAGATGSLVARPANRAGCNIAQVIVLKSASGRPPTTPPTPPTGPNPPTPPPPPPPGTPTPPGPPRDTTAPSAPGNVRSTGATRTTVAVAWNASTDNVHVAGYSLFRNGNPAGSTGGTSTNITGLTCATTYTFGVEAFDAAGNRSTRSTVSAATTACSTTPPPRRRRRLLRRRRLPRRRRLRPPLVVERR